MDVTLTCFLEKYSEIEQVIRFEPNSISTGLFSLKSYIHSNCSQLHDIGMGKQYNEKNELVGKVG